MKTSIAIDGSGRLIIPKPIRDRLRLVSGTEFTIAEEDGRIVLTPQTRHPEVVEQDGLLVLDPGVDLPQEVDHRDSRDQRLLDLVEFALLR